LCGDVYWVCVEVVDVYYDVDVIEVKCFVFGYMIIVMVCGVVFKFEVNVVLGVKIFIEVFVSVG